jgi:hypothetical protein
LLKIVAAYDSTVAHFHPTTLKKRQMYVRSSVKLLVNCTTKYKSLISTNAKTFTSSLSRMLDDMESVVTMSKFKFENVLLYNFYFSKNIRIFRFLLLIN